MDYYKRYMGDYQRDTGDLSLAQHGAYTVLLDHYYSVRKPLPAAMEKLHRLCRATTKGEQEAVETIADEFFPVGQDGLRHNGRADEEIEKWDALAAHNREVGKKGGNPLKKQKYNDPGSLYAARLPDGRIKVGITADISKRRYGLSRTHGAGVVMLHAVAVSDMGKAEAELLAEFNEYADGEILSLDDAETDRLFESMSRFGQPSLQASGVANDVDLPVVRQPIGVAKGAVSSARLQPSPTPNPNPEARSLNHSQNHTQSAREGEVADGQGGTKGDLPRGDDFEQLGRVKAVYPKGDYDQADWLEAQRSISRQVDDHGHSWEQIVAGAQRYGAQQAAKGNLGTQFVKSPKTFFACITGARPRFLEEFPVSESKSPEAGTRKRWHPDDGDPTEPKAATS